MNNIFESWKAYLTEQLLIESRLTDAIAAATNFKKRMPKNVVNSIPEEHASDLKKQLANSIKYMSSRDPSDKNKYLMWSARYLVSQLGEYLQFGEYDSEKMHYIKVPRYDKLGSVTRDADPDEQRAQILGNATSLIQQRAERLADRLILFDKGTEMGMVKGGIDQYKPEDADNIESFDLLVNAVERKVKEAEMMKRYEKTAKETSDILADEEDYMMVRPNSEEASCYYGRGTRWCISATQAQNYFNQYTGQGKVFYFVNFHHLNKLDIQQTDVANFKKLALVYGNDGGEYEPEEVFDMSDEEIGTGGLRDAVMHNLVAKALKSMSDYEDYVKKFGGEPSTKPFVDVLDYNEDEDDGPEKLRMLAQALGVVGTPIGDESEEEMRASIEEMISEQVSEIEGSAAYHFEQNPGGPSIEKFDEMIEAADLSYITVSVEDYESIYWNAGARINIEDLDLIEDDDIDEKVQSVIEDTLSNNHIYADEIEVHDADNGEVYVSFNPDYDEQQGLDQFETFLERMSGYDEAWPDMMDALASDLMDAGLTAGALVDIKKSLEDTELKNFDFEMEGGELQIETTIQTKVVKPEGIANNPKMVKYMLDALTYKTSDVFNKMEDTFFAKVESMIRTALNYYYSQEVLDFGDEDDREEIFPSWNLGLHPVFADLHREKGRFSGPDTAQGSGNYGGGALKKYDPADPKEKVLQLPYRFYITMNNEEGWEDMDLHDPAATHPIIKFLKFIDQEDMQFKLEEALTNAILEGLKVHMAQVEKTAEFEKEMAKSKPPVKLDTGDDEDQDVTQGGSFDAPLGPGQVAEMCGDLGKKKGKRLRIKIKESKKKKRLDEIKPSVNMYQFEAILGIRTPMTNEEPGLEDYKNSIRVRCGITVVDNIGASTERGDVTYSRLKIKFSTEGRPEFVLKKYSKIVSSISGVRRFRLLPNTIKNIKVES